MNSLLQSFKTAVVSNKMEYFSYKGGCCICGDMHTCIEAFKRRPGLGYR